MWSSVPAVVSANHVCDGARHVDDNDLWVGISIITKNASGHSHTLQFPSASCAVGSGGPSHPRDVPHVHAVLWTPHGIDLSSSDGPDGLHTHDILLTERERERLWWLWFFHKVSA